jgi:hypothetical protein
MKKLEAFITTEKPDSTLSALDAISAYKQHCMNLMVWVKVRNINSVMAEE